MYKFERIIYWSGEDDNFIVEVPKLPGCMAGGDTPENALQNREVIIGEWLETSEALGRAAPEPKGKLIYA